MKQTNCPFIRSMDSHSNSIFITWSKGLNHFVFIVSANRRTLESRIRKNGCDLETELINMLVIIIIVIISFAHRPMFCLNKTARCAQAHQKCGVNTNIKMIDLNVSMTKVLVGICPRSDKILWCYRLSELFVRF